MEKMKIVPAGDLALLVQFEQEISTSCNEKVTILNKKLLSEKVNGIVETVPTFCSLLVYYDPLKISYGSLVRKIKAWSRNLEQGSCGEARVIRIPVCYGGKFGEDMPDVCRHTGFTEEEVIKLHTENDYLIYMLGFLPGFPYLGGLDKRLATPRLQDPRTSIPAGAVGIGGEQTGIYPMSSPGGWRLIGQTPLCLYDAKRENPILYKAGDYIRFYAISEEEYYRIEKEIREGSFAYETLYSKDKG